MCTKVAMRAGTGALVLLLGLSVLALGAKREDPDAAGELYGDLYVIERDGNGKPVLRDVTYEDSETEAAVTVACAQPLAEGCGLLPLWGECGLEELPGGVLPLPECTFDPEAYDPCAVYSGAPYDYADQVQEVSFGRGSVARAQDFVIDSAYAEFIKTINEAEAIALDPAGRIQLEVPAEDPLSSPVWKTIDAPLENLGLYREIMTNGCLGTVTDEVMGEEGEPIPVTFALDETAIDLLCGGEAGYPNCPADEPLSDLLCAYPDFGDDNWWSKPTPDADGVTNGDLLLATAFLAGATDKGDSLSLDEIINLNTYLGLNSYTWEKVKKDRILTVTYFDFGDFTYQRSEVFPTDILWDVLQHQDTVDGRHYMVSGPVPVFGSSPPGVDLGAANLTVCRDGLPQADVCDLAPSAGCGGANYFAQAAEHARKTIWFVHNWEVPEIAY